MVTLSYTATLLHSPTSGHTISHNHAVVTPTLTSTVITNRLFYIQLHFHNSLRQSHTITRTVSFTTTLWSRTATLTHTLTHPQPQSLTVTLSLESK